LFPACISALLAVFLAGSSNPAKAAVPAVSAFPVTQHSDAAIEWWYLYAHITTVSGRHLAVVGSFFQIGNGRSFIDPSQPAPRSHYLLYAVTDLDRKVHRSYSLADSHMRDTLEQAAPLLALSATNREQMAAADSILHGRLPAPHQLIRGECAISDSPFRIAYGSDQLTENGSLAFTLDLGHDRATDTMHLTFSARKPPMAVGGRGETGLKTPGDMHYFSLTRCAVSGSIDTGAGPAPVAQGTGWFDHQWGSSWAAPDDGWDWWGLQLDDGRDVLVFEHRDLATGRTFFPEATIMFADGAQRVWHRVRLRADPHARWKSAASGKTYPLRWRILLPEAHLQLLVTPLLRDQEIPVLTPSGDIWEGACTVLASRLAGQKSDSSTDLGVTSGFGFMELVGYGDRIRRRR
jgi:predicted secreted hydrolase